MLYEEPGRSEEHFLEELQFFRGSVSEFLVSVRREASLAIGNGMKLDRSLLFADSSFAVRKQLKLRETLEAQSVSSQPIETGPVYQTKALGQNIC